MKSREELPMPVDEALKCSFCESFIQSNGSVCAGCGKTYGKGAAEVIIQCEKILYDLGDYSHRHFPKGRKKRFEG